MSVPTGALDEGEQRQIVEILLRTSTILTAELELSPLLQKLTDEATRLCRAQFGSFFYNAVDEAGESYVLYTISGVPRSAFEKFPMPRNTKVFDPTFRGEGVVRSDDVTRDPRYGQNPPHKGMPEGHLPVRSYLAVPVKSSSGKVIGGLFFGHAQPGVFRQRDEELLVALAAQAAVALDNARLFEEVRAARRLEEQRARLAEGIGTTMTGTAPIEVKLDRAVAGLVQHLDAAFARVYLADPASHALELRASAGDATGADAADPVIARIASERRGRIESTGASGLVVAAQPLLVDGEAIGVLAMVARRPLRPATLDTVGAVANQLAIAIERDRVEKESERFRALFLGMLGHDLRNPLSAISTGAQALLLMGELNEFSARTVDRMLKSAGRMGRMVTQILDFTRARSSAGIPIARAPGDLHALTRDVIEEIRTAHPDRQLRVAFSGTGKGDWDQDRIAQVLSNLIGNAIDHSREGTPVDVTVGDDGPNVVGTVHSVGPVISAELLTGIFDPFRRGPRHRKTAATQGLGLGLYISKHILVAHGGDLSVSSTDQEGTTFRFVLPRREAGA